jgi:hypothetical protein
MKRFFKAKMPAKMLHFNDKFVPLGMIKVDKIWIKFGWKFKAKVNCCAILIG